MRVGDNMQGKGFSDDELRKRREARHARAQAEAAMKDQDPDEDLPKFTWSDTFAMIIAAYQVLLPMLLASVAVIFLAFLLFRFIFS